MSINQFLVVEPYIETNVNILNEKISKLKKQIENKKLIEANIKHEYNSICNEPITINSKYVINDSIQIAPILITNEIAQNPIKLLDNLIIKAILKE